MTNEALKKWYESYPEDMRHNLRVLSKLPNLNAIINGEIKKTQIETAKHIASKLKKRADHLLKRCESPDSPMVLVSAELKINADEIEEAYNV